MKKKLIALLTLGLLCLSISAFAHTALLNCYLDGDKVICEGGFSDGSSAAGVKLIVRDGQKKILIDAKLDDQGTYEFQKPEDDYEVEFNAGPGHQVIVDGKDIE